MILLSFNAYSQTIEFVVSASPGGPADSVTRKIVEKIEKQTNLQLFVTNKPGAAHTIAYAYVMNSNKPTLILSTPEIETHEAVSFVTDIYTVGYFSSIVYVSEKSGIKNLKQLVELSKTRDINFGNGGVGSYSHKSMMVLCSKTIKCLDVPFKSGAEGMLALLTGTIDAYALVSYGSKQILENNNYIAIHKIKMPKENSYVKLFAKNLSDKDKETILSVLKAQDNQFYIDMGFEK